MTMTQALSRYAVSMLAAMQLAAAHAADNPKTILVMGDSLSAGYGMSIEQAWPTLLAQRLQTQGYGYRVANASVSGETSAGARARFAELLKLHRPDIVILEIGANDGLRGLPVKQTRENLAAMARQAKSGGARALIAGMQMPPNYGARYTEEFAAVFRDVAREQRLALAPFLLDGVALHPELMQADGLHPTAAAQPRILDNVWQALRPMLKKK